MNDCYYDLIVWVAVVKNKQRSEEIKRILEKRRSGTGKGGSTAAHEIRSKLNETRDKFKELVKQKQGLRQQFEAASKTREAARDSMKQLKSMIKIKDVDQIEQEIERLEGEIAHSSLSLSEEKKVMESIRQLKNSKATVAEYSTKMEELSNDESTCQEINAAIKAIDVEITNIRKEEDTLRAAMNAEKKKEEAAGNDNQSLWNEKEKCREACKEAYEKIKDLRAAFDQEWQEFKAQEKVWKAQQAEERARKREEYLKERALRDAERAAREAEMAPDPFTEEIVMCDQLAAYLGKLSVESSKEGAVNEPANADQPAALAGMKVLTKKPDDDADAWMMGAGKKKGKGKKSASKGVVSEKLIHTVDILNAFATLKLSVPVTKSDVPDILKKVEATKMVYLEKQAAAKERKDVENGDAQEPASGAGTSEQGAEESATSSSSTEKKQKKSKKDKPAMLKLDDENSWPSMGAPNTEEPKDAAADDDTLEEGELLPTPKDTAPAKTLTADGRVSVSIKVDGGSSNPVSLEIS